MGRLRSLAACALPLAMIPVALAWTIQPPADYGRVVLDERASRAGMAPAQFDHWRHRALYTCRLCHVDVGFAMSAGDTGITAGTNASGFHCGACHNGKTKHEGKPIFASCSARKSGRSAPACARCHARDDAGKRRKDYETFAAGMPKKGLDDSLDWEAAEARRLLRPADQVAGISIARPPLEMDKELTIPSRAWMTDVRFSHKKHSVWNGCEVCHPEIFPSGQENVRVTMIEISSGKSCGACHGRVAFALGDCERCHLKKAG